MFFSFGLHLKIKIDSTKRRLNSLGLKPNMVKLYIESESSNRTAWSLEADILGCETRLFVLGLLPECSATLTYRGVIVPPTYSDAHCVQRNLYTTE